ncbi:MAG: hypothetical protein HXX08_05200 [Chloroflexi bacterium]|uniref:Uncharacterized protein n=1 Tax=Candidatus Chlorohelix allophototropha TaxID=3003348 RepID=A0A8T7LT99_9CHLR|nr:hypothetical protein [Chloroflexota bacterium]WJW67134.1 hypothetical protein OZ401_000389 [Chloroflexota bacterium L227-S17]
MGENYDFLVAQAREQIGFYQKEAEQETLSKLAISSFAAQPTQPLRRKLGLWLVRWGRRLAG